MPKISELPSAGPITGGEQLVGVQGFQTIRFPLSNLSPLISDDDGVVAESAQELKFVKARRVSVEEGVVTIDTSSTVSSIFELSTYPTNTGGVVYLNAGGRSGFFLFDDSNMASKVTSDPLQGLYVAPNSDPSGASGAWARQFEGREVWAEWYGAVGDYVDWDNKGTDNWAAFQAALNSGFDVKYGTGKFRIHGKDLVIRTQGQKLSGSFNGFRAYVISGAFYPNVMASISSALVSTGTGERWIKTRRKYRASSDDPQDPPISSVIYVNESGVHIDRVVILNDQNFNSSVWPSDHTNIGADWDVAFFMSTRRSVRITNSGCVGFYRRASFYWDVTNISGSTGGQFVSPTHGNMGTIANSNIDQSYWENIFSIHALQGFVVYGPKPMIELSSDYSNSYYNQQTNKLVDDTRGGAGAADLYGFKAFMHPWGHPSNRRVFDPILPLDLDAEDIEKIPAGFVIDARGAAGERVRKITIEKIRVTSIEAGAIILGRCSEVNLHDIHTEPAPSTVGVTDSTGTPVDHDSLTYHFGAIAARGYNLVDNIVVRNINNMRRLSPERFHQKIARHMIIGTGNVSGVSGGNVISDITLGASYFDATGFALDSSGPGSIRRAGSEKLAIGNANLLASANYSFYEDATYDVGQPSQRVRNVYTTAVVMGGVRFLAGEGSPEGAVAAPVGSEYTRIDGSSGTYKYRKNSGTGNTGWVAVW